MISEKSSVINIIDKAIVFFFVLFLLTLTNSIFLNQLGYYSALLLVIAKGALLKENPFRKSGLEIAFIWFILSELLSLAFSSSPYEAVIFMLKRVLIIPIVYTAIAASTDEKKAKLFVKIYLGASLVSIIIYLGFSVQYFIYDLYSVRDSGPSIFQYPITVSEITSFTVVILFAFFLNENTSSRNKVLLFIGFALSVLALLSTYKRTGWMGAAFGIFMILVIKRKWSILVPAFILLIIFLFWDKNSSQVFVYEYQGQSLVQKSSYKTDGRAFDIYTEDTSAYVCDYEDGLLKLTNNGPLQVAKFPSPIVSVKKWTDSLYVANLTDTRFLLLKRGNDNFEEQKEFLSPGFTTTYAIANGKVYVNDKDSGLTIFNSPSQLNSPERYNNFSDFTGVLADSSFIALYSYGKGMEVYTLVKGLPSKKIASITRRHITTAALYNNTLIISGDKSTGVYSIDTSGVTETDSIPVIFNGFSIASTDSNIFILTSQRELFKTKLADNKLNIISKNKINFTPLNFTAADNNIYFTKVKRSRLLSFFDPYLPSNFNRIALWKAGFRMFKDHPLFGVGDVDLAVWYRHYKQPYDKEIQGHLHNNFVHVLATLGLFGFLAVCFLFFRYYQLSFRVYSSLKAVPFSGSFALGVIGAFSAFLVSGLTELNFFDHEIASLIWFLFGINTAFYYLSSKGNANSGSK